MPIIQAFYPLFSKQILTRIRIYLATKSLSQNVSAFQSRVYFYNSEKYFDFEISEFNNITGGLVCTN